MTHNRILENCFKLLLQVLALTLLLGGMAACGTRSAPEAAPLPASTEAPLPVLPADTATPLPAPTDTATPAPTATPPPPSATPVPPTPTPFAIAADGFKADLLEECGMEVDVTGVEADKLLVIPKVITIKSGGSASLWCYGAKHTWVGTLTYEGYTFSSDAVQPLLFRVDEKLGYAYTSGKGIVTLPDGGVTLFGYEVVTEGLPAATARIRLSPGKFGKAFWLEVVQGRYQLAGGDTLLEGSSIDVNEDWLVYSPGLVIEIGAGGATLGENVYPQGLWLAVDRAGSLVVTLPEGASLVSASGSVAAPAAPAAPSEAVTYLAQLTPLSVELGYGEFSVGKFAFDSGDTYDNIHTGDPILINGLEYPQALFAHAPARFVYNLEGKYSEFLATVGLVEWIQCGDGVEFVLLLDGVEIYRSKRLFSVSKPLEVQVPIAGGQQLELIVETGAAENMDCDWGLWGDPRLTAK